MPLPIVVGQILCKNRDIKNVAGKQLLLKKQRKRDGIIRLFVIQLYRDYGEIIGEQECYKIE